MTQEKFNYCKFFLLIFVFLLISSPVFAIENEKTGAPKELQQWKDWVLFDYENNLCPGFDPLKKDSALCNWPLELVLDLNDNGGKFTLNYKTFKKGFFFLPGSEKQWPNNVKLNEEVELAVLGKTNPQIELQPGEWKISGQFSWNKLPDLLTLPKDIGLLKLKINNEDILFPKINNNELWLKDGFTNAENNAADKENSINVIVSRLITDSMPLTVTTHLKIFISGTNREEILKTILLPNSIPIYLNSKLPISLGENGDLKIQAQIGVWDVFLTAYLPGEIDKVGPSLANFDSEAWAFSENTTYRQVEISGASRIDPKQTNIYPSWINLPVYLLNPEEFLQIKTLKRGITEPNPDQLHLARTCWLAKKSNSLSCQDNITGTVNKQWYFNVMEPFKVGRISLNGEDQLITWQKDQKNEESPGLQVRFSNLNLLADLNLEKFKGTLPASGWDRDFKSVSTTLNLPVGYSLLTSFGAEASSIDGLPFSWLKQWQALDIFFILIIVLGVFYLYGFKWSLVSFITLILTYQMPGAPNHIYFHLLATSALLKFIPKSFWRKIVCFWRAVTIFIFILIVFPFLLNTLKVAIYPQLENVRAEQNVHYDKMFKQQKLSSKLFSFLPLPTSSKPTEPIYQEMSTEVFDQGMNKMETISESQAMLPARSVLAEDETTDISPELQMDALAKPLSRTKNKDISLTQKQLATSITQAPEAIVQQGLGVPNWTWRKVELNIFAPLVAKDHEIKLWIIGSKTNSIIKLISVVLLTLFSLSLLEYGKFKKYIFPKNKIIKSLVLVLFLGFSFNVNQLWAEENSSFPNQVMLEEFQKRLLKQDKLPEISSPLLNIIASEKELILEIEINATEESILDLPLINEQFFRVQSLHLEKDNYPLPLIKNLSGEYITLVPLGINKVILKGNLRFNNNLQIGFKNTLPKKIKTNLESLRIDGLDDEGHLTDNAVYLVKKETDGLNEQLIKDDQLQTFYKVERVLSLGLKWRVYTTVTKTTDKSKQSTVKIPLLIGEKPNTKLNISENIVTLSFDNNQSQISWESSLDETDKIELIASKGPFIENWLVDISGIWSFSYEGLAPTFYLDSSLSYLQPQWNPWAGEKLSLNINRPLAVEGNYFTIDKANLNLESGQQNNLYTLSFDLRSSLSKPYKINIPKNSTIEKVLINNLDSPYEYIGEDLIFNIALGQQTINITWTTPANKKLIQKIAKIDLKAPIANTDIFIKTKEKSLVLYAWGTQQSPVIEFWYILGVFILLALVLAKTKITPLGYLAWIVLALGFSQLSMGLALIFTVWLFLLALRGRKEVTNWKLFNFYQIIIVVWSLITFLTLFEGLKMGLANLPNLQIKNLHWFEDDLIGLLPQVSYLYIPTFIYQTILFIWFFWFLFSMISWLKWAWKNFNQNTLWKKNPNPKIKKSQRLQKSPQDTNSNLSKG